MEYKLVRDGSKLTIYVRGALDATTSKELEAALEGKLDDVTDLTLDLNGLAYVSSMGLRLLLVLFKRMEKQGTMHVVNIGDEVMSLFDITGFSGFMPIE